jgi:chromosome segregation ATPase
MSLLSSSPLLASQFLSYANRAAAPEPASTAPSPESEERKALRETIVRLLEENQKLKSESRGMVQKLRATEASQEASRSRLSPLKETNTTQQGNIGSLREELVEIEDKYDRFMLDSNAERAALRAHVLDLEVRLQSCPVPG